MGVGEGTGDGAGEYGYGYGRRRNAVRTDFSGKWKGRNVPLCHPVIFPALLLIPAGIGMVIAGAVLFIMPLFSGMGVVMGACIYCVMMGQTQAKCCPKCCQKDHHLFECIPACKKCDNQATSPQTYGGQSTVVTVTRQPLAQPAPLPAQQPAPSMWGAPQLNRQHQGYSQPQGYSHPPPPAYGLAAAYPPTGQGYAPPGDPAYPPTSAPPPPAGGFNPYMPPPPPSHY